MNRRQALQSLIEKYQKHNLESPEREAEFLFIELLRCSRSDLLLQTASLSAEEILQLDQAVQRRLRGEPLAYILGNQPFFKSIFDVNKNVLIPRQDSETVIEVALSLGPFQEIADLGVGSGCLGLSLAKEWSSCLLWGCDISKEALTVAQENAKKLEVSERTTFHQGDVRSFQLPEKFQLIVSNPPYISVDDARLAEDVKKFEPHQALFAADNGLEFYKNWTPWALKALKKMGWLIFEVGQEQHLAVEQILKLHGFNQVLTKKDLSGIQRVVFGQKGQ